MRADEISDRKGITKFVEWHLINYPVHKQLLSSYIVSSNSIANGKKTNRLFSATNKLGQTPDLSEKLDEISWYVEAIDDLLQLLSPEEKLLLEERYFSAQQRAAWQVANSLYISRSEFYRRRDLLLEKFARRFGLYL